MDRTALTLPDRIDELVDEHGSLRSAARALKVDVGYLSRLRSGAMDNPQDLLLWNMGLERITIYRRL